MKSSSVAVAASLIATLLTFRAQVGMSLNLASMQHRGRTTSSTTTLFSSVSPSHQNKQLHHHHHHHVTDRRPHQNKKQHHHHVTDRRLFGTRLLVQAIFSGSAVVSTLTAGATEAMAKITLQEKEDKEKLVVGLQRLNYLLDNWEKETTVCGQSDNPYIGLCERTPIKVMEYLGYKSMQDPLFKADKTLKRLSVNVSSENGPDFLDAMEKFGEAAEEASGMAYISSWGEANPGGGKDRVALFLERAKKNVIDARDSLATALDLLEVS